MADISQITLPDGNTYSFKDASARTSLSNKIGSSEKGAVNGVAELDSAGSVPVSQLPGDVKNVVEYSSSSSFPATGTSKTIYFDTTTNAIYRWSGSTYVQLNASATSITNAEIDLLFA